MVNTGNPPIPGASDNNTPASSKINSQNSRTIVLCFDGTDNQFCEKVRRSAATHLNTDPSLIWLTSYRIPM